MLLAPKHVPSKPLLNSRPITCTECRRRHQKCNPRESGPCENCLRRFPQPKCIMKVVANLEAISRSSAVEDNDAPRGQTLNIPLHEKNKAANSSPDLAFIHNYSNMNNISPRSISGILTALNLPELGSTACGTIKPTPRNVQLFLFFFKWVGPNLSSIDGEDAPPLYLNQALVALLQFPIMAKVFLLLASTQMAVNQGLDPQKCPHSLSIKAEILAHVNYLIKQDFNVVGLELTWTVLHLAMIESFLGSYETSWSHMRGIKQMLRISGGIKGYHMMTSPVIANLIIFTDYKMAICGERELYLQEHTLDFPIPELYPIMFTSPLLTYPTTFEHNRDSLGLSASAADILDNIRFLTLSITSPAPVVFTSEIRSTAAWLHRRIEEMKLHDQEIDEREHVIIDIIRQTALVYTTSIATLTPFSKTYTTTLIRSLEVKLNKVPLSRWKQMPGLFFWILIVACPISCWRDSEREGRFWRRKMSVAALVIGLENFYLAAMPMRSFYKVQRWIAEEAEEHPDIIGHYYGAAECVTM